MHIYFRFIICAPLYVRTTWKPFPRWSNPKLYLNQLFSKGHYLGNGPHNIINRSGDMYNIAFSHCHYCEKYSRCLDKKYLQPLMDALPDLII